MAAALIVLAAVAVVPRLFPVNPRAAAAASDLADGQQAIEESHNYQDALADFQAATGQTPSDPEAWAWLGTVQQELGNAAAAKAAFDRSRALSSSETDFLLTRSAGYVQMNMNGPAQADLAAVLKTDPQNARAYLYLANVEQNEGQVQAAEATLAKASARWPRLKIRPNWRPSLATVWACSCSCHKRNRLFAGGMTWQTTRIASRRTRWARSKFPQGRFLGRRPNGQC